MNDVQASLRFDGSTFSEELDGDRLRKQLARVKEALSDGKPWTLDALMKATGIHSSASCSARARDLRKKRFGEYDVKCRRVAGGVYVYQMFPGPDGIGDVFVTP